MFNFANYNKLVMIKKLFTINTLLGFSALVLFLSSCSLLPFGNKGGPKRSAKSPGSLSTATGREYFSNYPDEGDEETGFVVPDYSGQVPGPNQVLIEGGRAVLGTYEEDVFYSHDNIERTVTVTSFFLDETEIANIHWLEYLNDLKRSDTVSEEVYNNALPDTSVWFKELAFNTPYVDNYLRYPGFRYYPVVGVSWEQANDYCNWRTAVVNYDRTVRYLGKDEEPEEGYIPPIESGVLLPSFRLPTEAEWEYAAYGQIGNQWLDEMQTHRRLYPWNGKTIRSSTRGSVGKFRANFKRGRGDYAGIAGALNDRGFITVNVYEYEPNDFGLYNMSGNVNEWVYDIYRPLTYTDVEDLNPLRQTEALDPEGLYNQRQDLINNTSRVYKGGSWADQARWLSPGMRRFMAQDSSSATVGFRCATHVLGPLE